MHINEITQRLPTYQAQLKVNGSTVTTQIKAANITQAGALLMHFYGAANVVALTLVPEQNVQAIKNPPRCRSGFLDF